MCGAMAIHMSLIVSIPGHSDITLDKLFMHMCLCLANSIYWYWPRGGNDLKAEDGKAGLAEK